MNSRQSCSLAGSVTVSNDPLPAMRILSVIGSPTPTDTGPASYWAREKSPMAPWKDGGAPLVGMGRTLISAASLVTVSGREPLHCPKKFCDPKSSVMLQLTGPRRWLPVRVAVAGMRKLSQLYMAFPWRRCDRS